MKNPLSLYLNSKIKLNKFKRMKIKTSIFSDHNKIKLEIKKNIWKIPRYLKIKQYSSK